MLYPITLHHNATHIFISYLPTFVKVSNAPETKTKHKVVINLHIFFLLHVNQNIIIIIPGHLQMIKALNVIFNNISVGCGKILLRQIIVVYLDTHYTSLTVFFPSFYFYSLSL